MSQKSTQTTCHNTRVYVPCSTKQPQPCLQHFCHRYCTQSQRMSRVTHGVVTLRQVCWRLLGGSNYFPRSGPFHFSRHKLITADPRPAASCAHGSHVLKENHATSLQLPPQCRYTQSGCNAALAAVRGVTAWSGSVFWTHTVVALNAQWKLLQ
jgi:hypothetical protein